MSQDSLQNFVQRELYRPLTLLCSQLAEEEQHGALAFFAGILALWQTAEDEEAILVGCLEISKAAFLGITYSQSSARQLDLILASAIELASVMSAGTRH